MEGRADPPHSPKSPSQSTSVVNEVFMKERPDSKIYTWAYIVASSSLTKEHPHASACQSLPDAQSYASPSEYLSGAASPSEYFEQSESDSQSGDSERHPELEP